ncbi:MAG TPA: hypothetical protein VFV67_26605 [Actinophytocola sp.]|uniref:hypothetical protein n=1 Tax=Actinophytocola sp. TaxID=1872138 RepID=UPI002DBD0646|nr:hypothetical protein [Actinophytocola sp.]HEU5474234.1 hypothetical protein [Actinophytocola sp.]
MATRLLLEGPSLETLLEQVHAEHGPQARIVSADRLQRGGIMGFFGRQWFEIGVEVPDQPAATAAPAAAPTSAPAPDSVEALLNLADHGDSAELAEPAASFAAEQTPTFAAALADPTSSFATALAESTPSFAAALASAKAPAPAAHTSVPALVGAATPAYAAVQPRVPALTGASTQIPAPALAGAATPWYAAVQPRVPALTGAQLPGYVSAQVPAPALAGGSASGFAGIQAAAPTAAEASAFGTNRPPAPAPVFATDGPGTPPPGFAAVPPAASTPEPAPTAHTPEPAPPAAGPTAAAARKPAGGKTPATKAASRSTSAKTTAAAPRKKVSPTRVTVPVAPHTPEGSDLSNLLVALPGRIVLIAGELPWALDVATWVCRRMRIAPNRMLVAGPDVSSDHQRIYGPEHAGVLAGQLRGSGAPIVVVVDAPVSEPDGGTWAGSIARALAADAVISVVDATRKIPDLRRHLADLGTAQAMAVYAASSSPEPDTILDLGLPVLLVDGRPVGPDGPKQALLNAR